MLNSSQKSANYDINTIKFAALEADRIPSL